MEITTRPYSRAADQDAVLDLLRVCRAASRERNWPNVAELRFSLLGSPTLDPTRDARLWEDAAGPVCGFAMVWRPRNYLVFFVHPEASGGEIEPQIMAWAVKRAGEIGKEQGERIQLHVRRCEGDAGLITRLERHGFVREDWCLLRFTRTLGEPIPEPALPPGFTIRAVAGEAEVEAYVALHREAFGTSNKTVEGRLAFMRDLAYVPDLGLVAVAPDGTLAAFVVGGIEPDEDLPGGPRHGFTDPIGTRPAFRRLGLARALLLEAFRRLQARGVEIVEVGTGSRNTATQALLASVGYHLAHRVLAYSQEV
jgi:ribosomal protein S18 acetylase RimI-like enzyme